MHSSGVDGTRSFPNSDMHQQNDTLVDHIGPLESLDRLDIFRALAIYTHSISSTFITAFFSSELIHVAVWHFGVGPLQILISHHKQH
jgi:hypothetical protein